MQIFINDILVNLVAQAPEVSNSFHDVVLNGRSNNIDSKKLRDDVLIEEATANQVQAMINLMQEKRLKELDSITFAVHEDEYKAIKKAVKAQFKVVKAGGGIVEKGDHILLIFRKGKWDIPKGKLDKGEKKKDGAVREVEEECNIQVKALEKICHTWHTYIFNGKKHLKKTSWYRMECLNDKDMKPQLEESITDVRWMDQRHTRQAMVNSFRSIRFVIKNYYSMNTKPIQ